MPPKKGKSKAAAATEVVRSSRFKTLEVDERISIKSFVEKHKLKFATGRGFYQLTKPETIQFHKEIVVRRKSDGKMASGDEVKNCFFLKLLCVNLRALQMAWSVFLNSTKGWRHKTILNMFRNEHKSHNHFRSSKLNICQF